jgi:quinohemoprotein ethanol dehydrogenase
VNRIQPLLGSFVIWLVLTVPLAAQTGSVVDDAMLRNPPAEEWLTYGRDYAETRFSPLTLIDRTNVQRLRELWSQDIPGDQGLIEATPLVHDGVMYFASTWGVTFALDARTGEVKWKWDPGVVQGGRDVGGQTVINGATSRGVAIYNGKIYVGVTDGRLAALDAETGEIVWLRMTTPYGNSEYMITGAPRVYNGKVIIGNAGRRVPQRPRLRNRLRCGDGGAGLALLHRARRSVPGV